MNEQPVASANDPPRPLPAHHYVVLDGKILVAAGPMPPRGTETYTADLYRNLDELHDGIPCERGVVLERGN